jgi:hypothetical protein
MSHIVEVNFLDQTLLLTCETTTTISELGNLALLEYEQAYVNDTPKTIKYIKDSKGRILSGTIQLIALNLEKCVDVVLNEESSSDARALDPKSIKSMYARWQLYTSRQMEMYFQSLSAGGSPSTESLQLLDDLKHTKSGEVQNSVLKSYELALTKVRNNFVVQAVAEGIQQIFRSTESADIALASLRLLQVCQAKPECSLDSVALIQDVRSAIKRFPQREGDIISLCESVGVPPTHATLFSPPIASPGAGPVDLSRSALTTDAAAASLGRSMGATALAGAGPMAPAETTGRPSSSGGMSLDRVVELLSSEDPRCRSFALDKIDKRGEFGGGDTVGGGGDSFIQSVVTACEDSTSRNSPPRMNGAITLLRALFTCLKASLQPPEKPPSRKEASRCTPLAYLVADSTLRSEGTQLSAAMGSLRCIYKLIVLLHERGYVGDSAGADSRGRSGDTLESILSERWRLLLTLAHAHDRRDAELCEKASDILLLLVSTAGWSKYRIKLDRESVLYFLESERPIPRTYLAIEFLLHVLHDTASDGGGGSAAVHRSASHVPAAVAGEVAEGLLCAEDFLVLKAVWKWAVGRYRPDVTMKGCEVLSLAVGISSVKRFLIKFEATEKVRKVILTSCYAYGCVAGMAVVVISAEFPRGWGNGDDRCAGRQV